MDETTFRILDAMMHDLGGHVSINGLTNDIRKMNHTAHYKNVYDKIKQLEEDGYLTLEKIGNSSIISLSFSNQSLTDLLAQAELMKKERLLRGNAELGMLFLEMEAYIKDIPMIDSISMINPEKNISLNRAEFMIILKEPAEGMFNGLSGHDREKIIENQMQMMHSTLSGLQKIHNIKIDYLILSRGQLRGIMKRSEQNPVKEMMPDQIALFYPQNYWLLIKNLFLEGIRFGKNDGISPAKISEGDMAYNLARFGYKEIGPQIREGREFCLESIIVSILVSNDQRRIEAIPMLLSKASSSGAPVYSLLIFLCMKHNKLGELHGLLKALDGIEKSEEAEKALRTLQALKIRPAEMDEKSIREKMRMYHGDWKK